MIRQFKQENYAEVRGAIVRKGDLISLSGVVGILHSEYDPDYMELETESGSFYAHFGCAEAVKLQRIEHANGIRGLNLKKARR
jgi:hypothetical protein